MTYHRETGNCKRPKVPICQIEDKIKARQAEHFKKTGCYLSVPRAIVQLVSEHPIEPLFTGEIDSFEAPFTFEEYKKAKEKGE